MWAHLSMSSGRTWQEALIACKPVSPGPSSSKTVDKDFLFTVNTSTGSSAGGRLTLYQRKVEVVLVKLATEDSESLPLQQHGLLLETGEELQGAALHVCNKHIAVALCKKTTRCSPPPLKKSGSPLRAHRNKTCTHLKRKKTLISAKNVGSRL